MIDISQQLKQILKVYKGIEHDRSSSGQTSFIEPLNIVSLNNKLKEYQAREREEIRKYY